MARKRELTGSFIAAGNTKCSSSAVRPGLPVPVSQRIHHAPCSCPLPVPQHHSPCLSCHGWLRRRTDHCRILLGRGSCCCSSAACRADAAGAAAGAGTDIFCGGHRSHGQKGACGQGKDEHRCTLGRSCTGAAFAAVVACTSTSTSARARARTCTCTCTCTRTSTSTCTCTSTSTCTCTCTRTSTIPCTGCCQRQLAAGHQSRWHQLLVHPAALH